MGLFIVIIEGCRATPKWCGIHFTWIYVQNIPYRYFKTLNTCAYSGHACTCSVYAYAYFERVLAYACMHTHDEGFLCTFSLPNHPSSQSFTRFGPKSTLGLQLMSSLRNECSSCKGYKIRYLHRGHYKNWWGDVHENARNFFLGMRVMKVWFTRWGMILVFSHERTDWVTSWSTTCQKHW